MVLECWSWSSLFGGLLVIVQMMLRWEDGKGEEKRILIHTEVDRHTYLPFLAFSTGREDQKG